ncbi:Detected protein of confused Function [Hibiscus syriacus]|uniref:Detected protein of confused Function n=1 Tax=Hibiscus syriacus TaxID=106335 RepID=A0A6A2WS44_HIBSY|nr:Detected protein of confused Function [Hibiscus syriacus]
MVDGFQTCCFLRAFDIANSHRFCRWRQHFLLLYSVDFHTDHHLFWAGIAALHTWMLPIPQKVSGDKVDNVELDAEQGNHAGAASGETSINAGKIISPEPPEGHLVRQRAGTWGYVFQIIFQMNAGAVLLTDCVFWFIIVPFLAIKDYNLSVLAINMHTINAVFLLSDTALNCLRFPCFRIAYFFLWTVIYVIFQWLVHACVNIWWPYPFLDLSSSYAPLWYFLVALMHFPCYGAFAFLLKLKHHVFSRWFPESYRCVR